VHGRSLRAILPGTIRARRAIVAGAFAAAVAALLSCGGGGGGDGAGGAAAAATTFTGNVAEPVADAARAGRPLAWKRLSPVAVAHAQGGRVEVCVEGTAFCALVGVDGFFTLAADVGGDVVLVFTGPDFTARVELSGIPRGATVRLRNVRCDTVAGTCEPADVEIAGGARASGPIRCERGPVHIVRDGALEIDGRGEDCVRAAGRCDLTIEAARVAFVRCRHCIRAAGGADVGVVATDGDIECRAAEEGLRSEGTARVGLSAVPGLGGIALVAGEHGIRAVGTSLVELEARRCRIAGGERAIRHDGDAVVDVSGCAELDLVGGAALDDDDDGDDDDHSDDGDDDGDDDHSDDGDEG
jgi:hypothetical protein